ncbi:hypothetical protein AX16_009221 [Volvariella volvacea WC 439]|nr:hypothetical protein AX16_009221 [Volvariella volvacea WC 439]
MTLGMFLHGMVLSLSSKTGGKDRKHAPISETSNVSAFSCIDLRAYGHFAGRQFRAVHSETARFQAKQFAPIPAIQFLRLISSTAIKSTRTGLEIIDDAAYNQFRALRAATSQLKKAVEQSNKRKTDPGAPEDVNGE